MWDWISSARQYTEAVCNTAALWHNNCVKNTCTHPHWLMVRITRNDTINIHLRTSMPSLHTKMCRYTHNLTTACWMLKWLCPLSEQDECQTCLYCAPHKNPLHWSVNASEECCTDLIIPPKDAQHWPNNPHKNMPHWSDNLQKDKLHWPIKSP